MGVGCSAATVPLPAARCPLLQGQLGDAGAAVVIIEGETLAPARITPAGLGAINRGEVADGRDIGFGDGPDGKI
ncbi:hypothetical protein ABLN97_03945 [Mycobacterium tuberculosis]